MKTKKRYTSEEAILKDIDKWQARRDHRVQEINSLFERIRNLQKKGDPVTEIELKHVERRLKTCEHYVRRIEVSVLDVLKDRLSEIRTPMLLTGKLSCVPGL